MRQIIILVSISVIILSGLITTGCNNVTSNDNYVGEAQTYWVNEYDITDFSKEIKCSVYRNSDEHSYEIEYEGTRYELIRDIPIDVNGDGSLILKYRFKDMSHYIEEIM